MNQKLMAALFFACLSSQVVLADSNSKIIGKDAGGDNQTTIVDENGNLHVIDKSKNASTTASEPQSAQAMPVHPSANPNASAAPAPTMPIQSPLAAPKNTTPGMRESAPAPTSVAPTGSPPATNRPDTSSLPITPPAASSTAQQPASKPKVIQGTNSLLIPIESK